MGERIYTTDAKKQRIYGLGLRHPHHQYVLQNNPKVDFFEVHSENFIAEGGASLNFLEKISEAYLLSFHCVGLSLGSAHGLDKKHLKSIKNLLDRFKPILFSDHLSWSNSASSGTSNDLKGITYGNSTFVTVGEAGTVLTSSDNGTSWTSRTSGTTNTLYGIVYKE